MAEMFHNTADGALRGGGVTLPSDSFNDTAPSNCAHFISPGELRDQLEVTLKHHKY